MKSGKELFNAWAANYDQLLDSGNASISFEGYEEVLTETTALAQIVPGMCVLDLGSGTGNLAAHFIDAGCEVWGMDFSEGMQAKAREKLPGMHSILVDLRDAPWPESLTRRYDRIVSAYVWHDFDLVAKMGLLVRLSRDYLAVQGRMVIADIAYPNQARRAEAQAHWGSLWSEAEHYWAGDETIAACKAIGLVCSYEQISSCAGIFVIEKDEKSRKRNEVRVTSNE